MRTRHNFHSIIEHLAKIQRISDAVLRNYGIDIPLKTSEIHLLDTIAENPDSNFTTLANLLWSSKMVISSRVRRLEKKGLLTVVQGRNRKELTCQLTERGQIAVDTHDAYHRMENIYLSERLNKYTEEELALVEQFLSDYANYLNDYAKDSHIL